MTLPEPVIIHPDDLCHCWWGRTDDGLPACRNTDCACLIHCVDEDAGWPCRSAGPHGARCEIRHGHIGAHGGMDRSGQWRQWT